VVHGILIYFTFAVHYKPKSMKKISLFIFPLVAALSLASCGGKPKDEEVPPTNPIQALANAEKNMAAGTNAADAKIQARRAKGDTLAMPYADLEKYLPENVDGYKKGEPTGESMNMTGMSWSTAEVDFTNDKNETIKVTLVDYNQAASMYTSMAAVWGSGFSMDSPEEKANGIKLDNDIAGWEDYHKKSKDVDVTLGIGYRFYLTVHADNQENTEFAKSVAKSMDLAKLSSL
jgi:hypothetical protein